MMIENILPNEAFKKQVDIFLDNLSTLKNVELPEPVYYKIDLEEISAIAKNKEWQSSPFFKNLYDSKKFPAVYYFSIDKDKSAEIFQEFSTYRQYSLDNKNNQEIKDKLFNLCYVPDKFTVTDSRCLYAGSVKGDLFGRLISHLGYGAKNNGGLHLSKIFTSNKHSITFNYYLLDKKFKNITEIIERVIQDCLQPIVGQKALKQISDK